MGNDVVITFKPVEPVAVEIDIGKLTWRDVRRIEQLQGDSDDGSAADTLNDLVRKCTGQEPDDMPAYVIRPIVEAILNRVQGNDGTTKN